jgi:hypothetical protein
MKTTLEKAYGVLSLPFETSSVRPAPTPVDSRGIVIPERVISLVKAAYPQGVPILRKGEQISIHEFYWEGNQFTTPVAKKFRMLAPNRGRLPRDFHTMLHKLTLPTLPPREEVMEEYNESWDIALSLLSAAALARRQKSLKTKRLRQLALHSERYEVSHDVVEETLQYFTKREEGSLRYFGSLAARLSGLPHLSAGFNYQGLVGADPDVIFANMSIYANNGARSMRPLLAV